MYDIFILIENNDKIVYSLYTIIHILLCSENSLREENIIILFMLGSLST